MAIDLAVSRAVTRIHALEKAVHERGSWTMDLDGLVVPAQRTLGSHGVAFRGDFPGQHNVNPRPVILRCDEQEIWASSPITPHTEPFGISFELSLPAEVPA